VWRKTCSFTGQQWFYFQRGGIGKSLRRQIGDIGKNLARRFRKRVVPQHGIDHPGRLAQEFDFDQIGVRERAGGMDNEFAAAQADESDDAVLMTAAQAERILLDPKILGDSLHEGQYATLFTPLATLRKKCTIPLH
jgi:hypothetical protein